MLEALSLLLVLARSAEPLGRGLLVPGPSGPDWDLAGPYCAQIDRCCQGRIDECAVPILGTLCYCDAFCNRTLNTDCCPDYFSHCHGYRERELQQLTKHPDEWRPPPVSLREGCFFNGRHYPVEEKIRNNCNDCQCIQMRGRAEMLCSRDKCMIDPEILEMVNRDRDRGRGVVVGAMTATSSASWTAANYSEFWGRSLEDGVSLRLGTLQPSEAVMGMSPLRLTPEPADLPLSFDAREAWPGMMSGVQDQGWCGASWALSTAAVAADRYAIMSMGRETPRLAAQHLLDCNNRKQHGCNGGHLDRAWYFTRKFGLVPESCYPWTGQADKCHVPKKATLQTARCPLRAVLSRKARTELYRMGPAYRLATEHDIMREIIKSGPVQATMQVYHDLFSYRNGIYQHLPLAELERTGYHSVRIIGWGEERGVKYWLVANSWGEWWGEDGYFRIRRGINECHIEELVLAAWAHTHIHAEHRHLFDNTVGTE